MTSNSGRTGADLPGSRSAFTLLELTVAIAVLGTALVIVAQTSFWSMRERWRNTSRQTALELAANALESARARPFADLTPEWAATQKLPDDLVTLLSEGRLDVRVEDDPTFRPARKVTVEVRWKVALNIPESVKLVTLLSPRTPAKSGGSP